MGDEREFEKGDQTCLPSQVLRWREGPLSSSLKYDYVKRIKWRRNGASPRAQVTFQREPGHLNTPLSPRRPSAGDGVSLLNDKGKLTFICLHLFPSPPSLCYYRVGPLFPLHLPVLCIVWSDRSVDFKSFPSPLESIRFLMSGDGASV